MNLDYVHDVQSAFRKILFAMSRPGEIVPLREEAKCIEGVATVDPTLALVAIVLLDSETSFGVVSDAAQSIATVISRLTYARQQSCDAADFVFALGGPADYAAAIRSVKIGTLVDPHLGATVLLRIRAITEEGSLALRGPGIDGERRIGFSDSPLEWLGARQLKCADYPVGVDLMIFDGVGNFCALPRTTRIAEGG